MSSFIVYNEEGRAQIMDRPLDMVLAETSIIRPEDVIERHYSNFTEYVANHYDIPKNSHVLKAYQPSKELRFANRRPMIGGYWRENIPNGRYGQTISNNPMSIYYFAWGDYGSDRRERYGIEVFNAGGEVTWASYQISMDILDVVKFDDLRTASSNIDDLYRVNFGHKNVAVIPVRMPDYLEGDTIYQAGWSFDENGALRIYRVRDYVLDSGELAQNRYYHNKYRIEFLVVDVSRAKNLINEYKLPRFGFY